MKNLFILTRKKIWILVGGGVLSILLHNLIGGLFNIEEPVFFIIAVIVIPLYFIISVVYTLIKKKK